MQCETEPGPRGERRFSALAAAQQNHLAPSPTPWEPDLVGWQWGSVINVLKKSSWWFKCAAQFESHWAHMAGREGDWGSHPPRQVYVPTSLSHSHLLPPESGLQGRTETLAAWGLCSPISLPATAGFMHACRAWTRFSARLWERKKALLMDYALTTALRQIFLPGNRAKHFPFYKLR